MDPQMLRLTRYGREPNQIVSTYKEQVKSFESDYQKFLEKEKEFNSTKHELSKIEQLNQSMLMAQEKRDLLLRSEKDLVAFQE